jgi:GNAT superfamily N-acetyltransferase
MTSDDEQNGDAAGSDDRPLHYDESWSEHWTLSDGTPVLFRRVRPDDRELLRAGFDQLSPDSRYLRFFTRTASLSDEDLAYLCDVDGWNHFALGAMIDSDEPMGVGIARFVRDPDHPELAEPAVAILDDYQGHGLGTALVLRLADAARERGIREFRFDIIKDNDRMRNLLEEVAPNVRFGFPSSGVMEVHVPIPDVRLGELELDREPWPQTVWHQVWVHLAREPGTVLSRVLKNEQNS